MSTDRTDDTATTAPATMASDNSAWAARSERWQGPSFAASWISPPGPGRFDDLHSANGEAPHREDDHA